MFGEGREEPTKIVKQKEFQQNQSHGKIYKNLLLCLGMKIRLLLSCILALLLINFVSAYYGNTIGDFLDEIGGENLILMVVFIVSFAVLNFALGKFFKNKYGEPNKATSGIVAFALSLLTTYGLYKTGFDLEGIFFDIGISSNFLYTIIPLIITAGIIFLVWKLKKKGLFVIGISLIIVGKFTELVYEKGTVVGIGIFILFIALVWWYLGRKKRVKANKEPINYGGPSPKQEYKQMRREQKEELRRQKYAQRAEKIGAKQERKIQQKEQARREKEMNRLQTQAYRIDKKINRKRNRFSA